MQYGYITVHYNTVQYSTVQYSVAAGVPDAVRLHGAAGVPAQLPLGRPHVPGQPPHPHQGVPGEL